MVKKDPKEFYLLILILQCSAKQRCVILKLNNLMFNFHQGNQYYRNKRFEDPLCV